MSPNQFNSGSNYISDANGKLYGTEISEKLTVIT